MVLFSTDAARRARAGSRVTAEMLLKTYTTFPPRQCSSRMEKMQRFGHAADRVADVS
jgi:hypothetical protein